MRSREGEYEEENMRRRGAGEEEERKSVHCQGHTLQSTPCNFYTIHLAITVTFI